jgi:hypothetical protein
MAARLSTLSANHRFTPGKIPGTHFYFRLSRPQGLIAAGIELNSIEKSSDLIRNRTRDLPAWCLNQLRYSVPLLQSVPEGMEWKNGAYHVSGWHDRMQ